MKHLTLLYSIDLPLRSFDNNTLHSLNRYLAHFFDIFKFAFTRYFCCFTSYVSDEAAFFVPSEQTEMRTVVFRLDDNAKFYLTVIL